MQKADAFQDWPEISELASAATIHWLPCGDGLMPVRHWPNPGAEKVVLLHGGSGSWLHWVRNIGFLQQSFDVYAPDLPGFGDAAMCSVASDADSAADTTLAALQSMFDEAFHVVAFSWGCTLTAMMMRRLAPRLKSVMLAGPAAVGELPARLQMPPLIKRTAQMSEDEVLATQRENLARLMIYKRQAIDDMAVSIQAIHTAKARFKSPQYARSTLVLDGLRESVTPLYVIYGDHDAPAWPELEARRTVFREIRPDVRFELVVDAGHWLQYEAADEFNALCQNWLLAHH